ncbi:small subunit processome component 20 homolog [Mercenaria mercenaria]|uniref:small subunit processome component 20 homolog n=1 Tax=Mercenaria mercenaria TaxID=6596 RepID=UPI00234ECF07|nr:small subunit processome component 20 homolog [Mercenaria mercenaria]
MGKSGHHKKENTFRFQTFSERITNINIDVIHQIRHHDDTPEETLSYFGEALHKQSELNCTDHFAHFKKEISDQVQTFAQLVYHEENIVSALKKHLVVANSMALPALLDLLVQLARDLQADFYRHFHEFFDILVKLLNTYTHDVEVLESTFTCLSYIFKFLWRYLLKDIQLVYRYFSSLLGKQYKEYVRNFAAESFAFLMRKAKDPSALFDFLFSTLEEEPDKAEGIGRLLFEMMKGVKEQFHSCTAKVFPVLMKKLGPQEKQVVLPWQQVEVSMTTLIVSMTGHSSKEHMTQIWDMLLASLTETYGRWNSKKKNSEKLKVTETLERQLRLIKLLMEFHDGKLIAKPDAIAKILIDFLRGPSLSDSTGLVLLEVSGCLLLTSHTKLEIENTSKLIPSVFKTSYPVHMIFDFTRRLFDLALFEKDVLPSLLKYCEGCMSDGEEVEEQTLLLITQLLLNKCPLPADGNQLDQMDTYMLDFGTGSSKFPGYIKMCVETNVETESITSVARVWAALVCLPHVRPLKDNGKHVEMLSKLIVNLMNSEVDSGNSSENHDFLACQALVSMVMILQNEDVFQHVPLDSVIKCVCERSKNVHMLRLVDIYFTHAVNMKHEDVLHVDTLLRIFPVLQENLSSPHSLVRLHTLRIFSSFDLPLPPTDFEVLDIFTICLCAETTAANVHEYREKLRHLQKLDYTTVQNSIPAGPFSQVPLRYLIGSLFVNFKLLWEPIRTLISSHAHNMERDAFWEVFSQQLEVAAERAEVELFGKSSAKIAETEDGQTDGIISVFTHTVQELNSCAEPQPSYSNFRVQMWKTMHEFPEKCSSKSRVFVPLLFRFLKNEYYLTDLSVAPSQNVLRQIQEQVAMETDTEESNTLNSEKSNNVEMKEDETQMSQKLRKRKQNENDSDESSDDDDVENVRRYTRSRTANIKPDGTEEMKADVEIGRVRTRSQCSVDDESSETKKVSKKLRTRGRNHSETEESDIDLNVRKKKGDIQSRIQTRSMDDSESEAEKSGKSKLKKATPVRRMRTRSSQVDTSEEEMSDDDDDEEKEEDNSDTEGDNVEEENKLKEKKRLSAIHETNDEMEVVMNEKDMKEIEKDTDKGKEKKGGINKDKSSKHDEGKAVVKKQRKAAASSLLVQLELFAKFKDPKSMFMESQLRQLYFDLLVHKNADVQRTAFQCILTYKYKYLIPYRENFNRLLEDKSFKNEIVLFSIDNENSVIDKEHRADVLPILMRILYGKMHVKTGKGTAGKQFSKIRQSIVLRFLNGCQNEELKMFIDLVFTSCQQFITENPYKMAQDIKENTDLTNVLPVKKMQGALNSIDMIFKKLGHLMDSFLPSIIQMIVGLGTLCGVLLENRNRLVPHVINPLKDIRQNSIYRMIQILEDYDKYPWRPVELDAMFEALVWPQLDKLSFEGLYHPTPLLKLLLCCTKNPRYFSLLGKHHKDKPELSPLPQIMKLLLKKDVSSHVTSCIMEMVYNLLEETDEEEEVKVIEVNSMINLQSAENVKESDIGIRLILPHVPDILAYIQTFVSTLNTQLHKKSKISGKELDILSRVSSFVQDEEMSATLVNLLLPFLNPKYAKPQKVEEDILTSILNLLKHISDRMPFFKPISKLFATLPQRPSRLLLTQAFTVICEEDEDLKPLGVIVQRLNSWDRTRMDEPDYMLRLEGYRSATSLLKSMVAMDTRICLTLIYNCCFFISTVEDMSLRDSSTLCMVTMVNQFGVLPFDEGTYKKVIILTLLQQIKTGLRSKKQTVFHEFVTILATLVDTFGDQPTFTDLKPLRDKDIDADFYENIKHIQVYKRSRALRRLIKYLYSNKVNFDTLTNIFLPMVSSFLIDDLYKKHTTVLDAAVDAIGTICKLLPWKSYLNQLRHYLTLLSRKLEKQKLLVRVIVSVLDNFHFDLSKSTLNVKNTPVPKVEREPEEKPSIQPDQVDLQKDEETATEDAEEPVTEINEEGETTEVELDKGKQLCSEPLATKIHGTILKSVIHQLHRILVQKARSDGEHKIVKSKYAEDEEILRVPIALAMVKLLQNLPRGALGRYLPGILLKVCNFLKSRSIEIRNTSRDTLVKIQTTLGPRFFPFILSELRGTLRRGYQRHVLCYTVHQLLKHMESVVRPGDIDICLKNLQEVLNEEIFGEVSDEKVVAGIKAKVFEARSSKSYESYEFIARYISPGSLMKFLEPIKKILDSTSSHKSARKVHEVLKRVTAGLLDNKNVTTETLLVFVHGLTTQTLPMLSEEKVAPKVENTKNQPGKQPPSCLLIPKAAPRGGLKPKASKKTNKHVLVEFGLQLLSMCLKKQKIVKTDSSHLQMLDPLVAMLADCLYSKYVLVNANSLRVLCKILKFPIPSLETHISRISSGMFILLRNYASAGAARGDNLELVSMLFKAITVLVREVKFYNLEPGQLQVLLTFCEEDIHDFNRQSTAFSLLKAILSRKLDIPEIHELMKKVEEMSISAETAHVQRECRQAMMQYLLDYRHGKKLRGHLQFYVSNLTFELETGRESALEMLASFFTSFPQNLLAEYSGLFFVPMAASLANDESAKCRKLIALAIKTLLGKLEHNSRTSLFGIALKWFMDEKLRHRSLAAQLCGLFVEVESAQFESRLSDTLPVIEQQLEPGKYKQVDSASLEHDQDLMIYHTLNTLLKILRECSQLVTSSKWETNMNVIWEHVVTYLSYPHIWVQLAASQLFGLLFAAWPPDQLVTKATKSSTQYISVDTYKKLRTLSGDFLTQLQSELLNDELASQVIKNMIFLTKCARYMSQIEQEPGEGEEEDKVKGLSVLWLVRKMVREANHEAINNNKMTIKRIHVFKWLAAVALDIGDTMETNVLNAMLPPLQRELNDQSMYQDASLRSLAQEVVDLLKKTVGVEKFTGSYASTQKVRAERKDERKRQRAVQAVANPELHAKRKLKKNLNKIEAKKRKIEHFKPSKKAKKRKYQEFAITD